jgi:hypothetical protein
MGSCGSTAGAAGCNPIRARRVIDALIVPLPLPGFIPTLAAFGIAVYLTTKDEKVDLIPEGLFVPLAVEVNFVVGAWLL